MKTLNVFFFAVAVLFFTACDSTETCTQTDWVGTYTGTANCDGDVNDANITITASGSDAVIIEYVVNYPSGTVTTTYPATTPDGCNLNLSSEDSGLTLTVDASVDGDNLTINEVITGSGTFTCNISATRD